VERGDAVDAELRAEERARAREDVVGRHRREEDVVDVARLEPRGRERALGRLDAEIARALALARIVALADPGALEDPLVRGVHDAREALVRDRISRYVVSRPDDLETHGLRGNSSDTNKRRPDCA